LGINEKMTITAEGWGWCSAVIASFGLITWTILFILKIDEFATLSWYEVFIPLWISYFFMSLVIFVFTFEFLKRDNAYGAAVWFEGMASLFILWTILLALKLEQNGEGESFQNVNWGWIWFPFWGCIGFVSLIDPDWPNYNHKFHEKTQDFWGFARALPINAILVTVAQTIVIALHSSNVFDCNVHSWGLCMTPLWYLDFIFICLCLAKIGEGEQQIFMGLPSLIALVVATFEILLALYLEGSIHLMVYVFIPVWLTLVVGVCGGFCLLCLCFAHSNDD